jgi:hypothetical protein
LSAEVLDEAIFNGQTPSESAHLIWTRLVDLYGKSKCDDAYECESMESMSIDSSCSGETLRNKQSTEPEQEMQGTNVVLSGCTYRTCPVAIPAVSGMARLQDSKKALAMMIELRGDQVMNQPQYLMIPITCVSWPRKARRRLLTFLSIVPY